MAQLIASRRKPRPLLPFPPHSLTVTRYPPPAVSLSLDVLNYSLYSVGSCSLRFTRPLHLINQFFLAFITLSRWPSPSSLLCLLLLLQTQTRTLPLGIPFLLPRGHLIESIAPRDRVPAILPLPSSLSSPPSPLPHWSPTLIPSSRPKLPSPSSIPPSSDSPPRPFRSVPLLLPRRIPPRASRQPHRRVRRGAHRMVRICLTSTFWETMAATIKLIGHSTALRIVL